MNNETLKSIRDAEKESHLEIYSTAKLFESGSWLQNPVKTVVDLLDYFKDYCKLNILDLGCGVGRNCIPIAQEFKKISCNIDCVDILDFAIEELNKNSIDYGVEEEINGIISSIDDFTIKNNHYDLIIAVSALEHINSEIAFTEKLNEIKNGIRKNGIVCLIINSEITEINKYNGQILVPQFEVNLKTQNLSDLLNETFDEWEVIKNTVCKQKYDIPRKDCISDLTTDVVTFVVKK
ncbi:MAG: class I SAM-dependent methyltransferase [Clostridia bacterium]|nr:class I SAM-dependent methyltransferase [Clostridia bacterium]